jgi:hypothetical protein
VRDYSKVAPTFWTGKTGRAIRRRGSEALVVAMYLMTSPHSNMLGLYYQPMLYMAHETGLGIEGASKGLAACIEEGFCYYDNDSEMVWVVEMASYQIAEELKASDNRCAGIQKDYEALPENILLGEFFERYKDAFHLTRKRFYEPSAEGAPQAPCEGLPSQEQEQEQAQEQKQEQEKRPTASSAAKLPTCEVVKVIDLYHDILPEMPKVRLQTKDRVRSITKTWGWVLTSTKDGGTRRATTAEEALAWFGEYFRRARDNDFLMGRTPRSGEHANWRCDLDFLLTDKGMKHVIEKTLIEETA